MGKLRGINLSPELRSIVDTVLALPQPAASPQESQKKSDDKNDSNNSSLSSSPRSASASSPSALLERAQEAKRGLLQSSLTTKEAKDVLENAMGSKNDESASPAVLPLAGVPALKYLITNSQSEPDKKTQLLQQLESALRHNTLSFVPKPTKTADPQYQKRLERLKLHAEERSYMNLTTNLKTASSLKDDNVTAKSMMYATSVGLNMVVAPITFGGFMYFFAGAILNRFFDNDINRGGNIDIRSVIAGVISGVFMLFVEMILFVIRSDTLDTAVRKKSKRKENRANPFGYTEKSMARTYVRED